MGICGEICPLVQSSIRPIPVHLCNKIFKRPETTRQERLNEESGLLSLSTCKGGAPPCPTQVYLKRLSGQPNLHHHPEATRPFTLPQQKPSGKNKKDVSPPSLGGVSGGLVGSLKSHLYQVAMWHPSLPRVSREAKWGSQIFTPMWYQ